MDKPSYQKLRLSEFNSLDIERTLRENIYDLEQENFRIEDLVKDMIEQKIPVSIILKWMRQMEDNAAEIIHVSSLVQHDLSSYNFSGSTVFKKRSG
jgi:hypothetical protein